MSKYYPNLTPYDLDHSLYHLNIYPNAFQTKIKMTLDTDFFHTNHLPSTVGQLRKSLPKILKSKCYNDDNLPFRKEVLNTEIGHLFEHILLEYLCNAKISGGAKRAVFRGLTSWDWQKDSKGIFYITLYIQPEDIKFLQTALKSSILLFNRIINGRAIN